MRQAQTECLLCPMGCACRNIHLNTHCYIKIYYYGMYLCIHSILHAITHDTVCTCHMMSCSEIAQNKEVVIKRFRELKEEMLHSREAERSAFDAVYECIVHTLLVGPL